MVVSYDLQTAASKVRKSMVKDTLSCESHWVISKDGVERPDNRDTLYFEDKKPETEEG